MPRKPLSIPVGEKFGTLLVLEEVESSGSHRQMRVVCDCGREEIKRIYSVLNGTQSTCTECVPRGTEKDVTGERFGTLIAVKPVYKKNGAGKVVKYWECLCDCGNITSPVTAKLLSGHTQSCGAGCNARKHPLRGTPTEMSWKKMLSRARGDYDDIKDSWVGVEVCDRWDNRKGGSFDNFCEDMGERPEGMTLNRINGSKIYSPETCEWATLSLQSYDQKRSIRNTSGRTGVYFDKSRSKWIAYIKKNKVSTTLYSGDSFEEACEVREIAELEYYGFTKE